MARNRATSMYFVLLLAAAFTACNQQDDQQRSSPRAAPPAPVNESSDGVVGDNPMPPEVTLVAGPDDLNLLRLPKGSRLGLGFALKIPQAPFDSTGGLRPVEIFDGRYFQKIRGPDGDVLTDLVTGERFDDQQWSDLLGSTRFYTRWYPKPPESMPAAGSYLELSADSTLPVFPHDRHTLRQDEEFSSPFYRFVVRVNGEVTDPAVDHLAAKDIKSIFGEQSYILVPAK